MKTNKTDTSDIRRSHTKKAIHKRLGQEAKHSYLKDFIYGAIDGTVTTFAVVAGSEGARFSAEIVIVLGLANLIADGFSMAISNYLGTKAEQEVTENIEKEERRHIEVVPEGEKEEIREIFRKKGFHGETLEKIVQTITSDKELWVKTMLQEEIGLSLTPISAFKAAFFTFIAFVIVGFFPLSTFIYNLFFGNLQYPFAWSSAITAITFFAVGSIKSRFIEKSWLSSGFETLFVGGLAATLAYFIGNVMKGIV